MSVHTDSSTQRAEDQSQCGLRRVIILGSTGSIGVQTLDVIEHLNQLCDYDPSAPRYQIVALAAGSNHAKLFEQAKRLGVRDLALMQQPDAPHQLDQSGLNLRLGADAARRLVEEVPCDLVVGAIVGIAGLDAVLRAIDLGIDVALANKETLVAAGSLVIESARQSGASLLPVDSEHAGIWQCLRSMAHPSYCPPMPAPTNIERVVLTASGGAFREQSRDQIMHASVDDALNHPNWSMGAKVTIDSATLMNKALELIEAHWLFGLDAEHLGAVIHPQSIIHAMVESTDASVIAQLGAPDMKSPIQHALCWPSRTHACAPKLDVTKLSRLDFFEIDDERFPAVNLAMNAIRAGGNAGAILNAANEQAVLAFMDGRIEFGKIDELVAAVMHDSYKEPIRSIEDVYSADTIAREQIERMCSARTGGLG